METKKKVLKCVVDDEMRLGVQAISLVEFPAIETNWVALSEVKLSAINEERRMLYGPALIPEKYILRLDKKTGEEFYIYFDKETVYKCAHQFMLKNLHHNHTLEHKMSVTGCTVVETWYKESEQDKSVALGIDVPVGTWMVGTYVQNDDLWSEVKLGKVKGFSIEGIFDHMVAELSDQNEDLFVKALIEALSEA
jgi:hypothetical protein